MAANTALRVTELDFDQIKANLKSFLAARGDIQDYDYEGATINMLLDLLAYNTYYSSYYLNMVGNEMFLDTALLRPNVVSIAKSLNYTPRSAKSAQATITLAITPNDNPTIITVPKGTEFVNRINNIDYVFSTVDRYTIPRNNSGQYSLTGVVIAEGYNVTHRYTVNLSTRTTYELPNFNVDTDSITVQVQDSSTSTTLTTYNRATDLTEIAGTTPVYFLQENYRGYYEIYFGDDIIGKAVENGNVVSISYRVCHGSEPNGARTFTPRTSISGYSTSAITATTTTVAYGGNEPETNESIKALAPLHYETQNRAVTIEDYKRIVLREAPDIQTVAAWGGEDNDPAIYGKVFISVKPRIGTTVSTRRKEQLREIIKKYNVLSIDPVFTDPTYLYINPTVTVHYNPLSTSLSAGTIAGKVATVLEDYENNFLSQYTRKFRYSKWLKAIDDADQSITNNDSFFVLEKRFTPVRNTVASYTISFNVPIHNEEDVDHSHIVTSSGFYISGSSEVHYLDDDGAGNMRLYYLVGPTRVYVNTEVGTVDYDEGTITIPSLLVTSVAGNATEISLFMEPETNELNPIRNQILLFAKAEIIVKEDRTLESDIVVFRSNPVLQGDTTTVNETSLTV